MSWDGLPWNDWATLIMLLLILCSLNKRRTATKEDLEIEELKASIEELKTSIEGLQSSVDSLRDGFDQDLMTEIEGLQGSVGALHDRVDGVRARIEGL